MPKSALIYAWTIIAIGAVILACALLGWHSSNFTAFLVCLSLALFSASLKLRLPKLTGTVSPAFIFVLFSIATLSFAETVVIAALSGLMQSIWRPKNRPTLLQVVFGIATMAIAAGAAHGTAQFLIAKSSPEVLVVALGAAAVTLMVTNTLIVSTILCLLNRTPLMSVWRSIQLRTAPYYVAGGVLATIWSHTRLV